MALLQALLLFLRRSLGKIFQAVFGWVVLALFGEVGKREKAFLSVAIGLAAAWPVLLVGAFFPRQAALFLAFFPVPRGVPEEVVRAVWILLAVSAPLLVGIAFGRKSRGQSPRPALVRRLLLGFPVTLGLAAAFLIVIVTAPVSKVVAMLHRRKQEHVVLVSAAGDYHAVARDIREALTAGGLPVEPAQPPWHQATLARLVRGLGGASLRAYIPEQMEYLRGCDLELTFYPGGVTVSGPEKAAARAHSLIAERAPRTAGLQTTSPEAQTLEKALRRLWAESEGSLSRAEAQARLTRLLADVAELEADYEEWEAVYRQALQLAVRVRGGRSLLEKAVRKARPTGAIVRRKKSNRSRRGLPVGKYLRRRATRIRTNL